MSGVDDLTVYVDTGSSDKSVVGFGGRDNKRKWIRNLTALRPVTAKTYLTKTFSLAVIHVPNRPHKFRYSSFVDRYHYQYS